MECQACKNRPKTWKGDDPKCGFTSGQFAEANWNCALVNEIRELATRTGDYRINRQCEENQQYASISLLDINTLPEKDGNGRMNSQPVCLWVGWYKNRGRTEAMWLMFETLPPRAPTEEECRAILNAYEKKEG